MQHVIESERDLRDFVETSPVSLQWLGTDGGILWANQAHLDLLGYTSDEYVGRSLFDFVAGTAEDLRTALANATDLHHFEVTMQSREGRSIDVALTTSSYFHAEKVHHIRCISEDLTDRNRTRELQAHLAAIVESSDDAIISKNLQGVIQSWNRGAERIFGYKPEEVIGKHISILAPPERVDEIPNIIGRIARGERVDHYRTKRRTKDGRILAISLTVSPIRDATGRIVAASKIARDITEDVRREAALRSTNEQLKRANADLEQFAYSASHDLKEPLRTVGIYSQLVQRKYASALDRTANEYLDLVIAGSRRMEALLDGLLAFTQAIGPDQPAVAPVSADAVLDAALLNLKSALQSAGASVVRRPLARVAIPELHLMQVFQNLIGNALKYRQDDQPPCIRIHAQPDGTMLRIAVCDNGIGIDPEYREQIFGLFKRLHNSDRYAGAGIGLSICQRIVERYGGQIWVESDGPGRGSTFWFTVPAAD